MNKKKIKQQNVFEKVKREIKVLRQFNHPHIIKHFEFIDTASDIFMVIEYASGGELFDYIAKKDRVSNINFIWLHNLNIKNYYESNIEKNENVDFFKLTYYFCSYSVVNDQWVAEKIFTLMLPISILLSYHKNFLNCLQILLLNS